MRRGLLLPAAASILLWFAACGPQPLHVTLPAGAGVPALDYQATLDAALKSCRDVRTFSARLSLSGQAGSQRLRGDALVGISDGALRLEALAPGGSAAFI